MTISLLRRSLLGLAIAAASAGPVESQSSRIAMSPLWGRLEPGRHAVGFRQLLLRDASRPAIGGDDGTPPPAGRGRQMQIAVWYPASGTARPVMPYGEYIDLLAQELDFAPLTPARRRAAFSKFAAQTAGLGGDTAALRAATQRLTQLRTAASRNAPPARGSFPLVVFPEWRMPGSNSILAEYLASHGFVVGSVTLKGSFDSQVEVSARGLETQVADLRFALQALDTLPFVDRSSVVAMGVGIAASGVLALQMRTPAVRALVSLEGGITTTSELALLAATPYYDVGAVRVPMLVITAPHPAVNPANLDVFRYATRHQVHFPRMGEFWFLNFGMLESHVPRIIGAPPGDTQLGFEWASRWVLRFLNATLRHDGAARAVLADSTWYREAPAGTFTVSTRDGLPAPPTLQELKRVVNAEGAAGVQAVIDARRSIDSMAVSHASFQALQSWLANGGRDPRGTVRHELALVRMRAFPQSSRARFTGAMSTLARGDTTAARGHLEETLRLLTSDTDSGLDAALRGRIDQQTRETLSRIGAPVRRD